MGLHTRGANVGFRGGEDCGGVGEVRLSSQPTGWGMLGGGVGGIRWCRIKGTASTQIMSG